MPGGRFDIRDGKPDDAGRTIGEVVYTGPNVMHGYASSAADLAAPDQHDQVLHTGDLGYLDDGFLTITGRIKRIAKVFGVRVGLDDVERLVGTHARFAAVAEGDGIALVTDEVVDDPKAIVADLSQALGLHRSGFRVVEVDAIPTNANGKLDYGAISALIPSR